MNIKEIAKVAKVSTSTVSLVLNSKPGVSVETRKRILTLLIENGYEIKSELDQQLMTNFLFVRYEGSGKLMESKDEFFMKIFDGVERQSRCMGINLSVINSNYESLKSLFSSASMQKVSGIILFATEFEQENSNVLLNCKIPMVLIDSSCINDPFNSIDVENISAMFAAVSHLHNLGHKEIGYLHSTQRTGSLPERASGYRSAMEKLNLSINPEHVFLLDMFLERACEEMLEHLNKSASLPTAFVSDNDVLAVGVISALKKLGYKIPEDISVIGFDDAFLCTVVNPKLTTLHIPREKLGQLAVKRLVEIIETQDTDVIKIRICTNLVQRGTTAPPKITSQ